jgi:cell division protein FtsZ
MVEDLMNFDLPAERSSIIKVVGVGGGGSNAINHMFRKGIKDVNFVVCNTDAQALSNSPVPVKIQLGESLTEGRGAGNKPEIGQQAAIENIDNIKEVLSKNTRMIFITAGMGGGTGTGAAPVIARAAKELGILTVAIVTIPFRFEGQQRINQAIEGINEIEQYVDSLLIINNEKLREVYGDLKLSQAFSKADDVLAQAAKGIAEIITVHGYINVDFADVETVMTNSGVAIMGSAEAGGEDRAIKAIEKALTSPLLNNNDITGAKSILLNIASGEDEVSMDEIGEITDFVNQAIDKNALVIWGTSSDLSLGDKISVTIIATGFATNSIPELYTIKKHYDKVPLRDSGKHEELKSVSGEFEIKDKSSTGNIIQRKLEFGMNEEGAEQYILYDDEKRPVNTNHSKDDHVKREERVKKLKEAHERLKKAGYTSSSGNDTIEQLENEPAYLRKNVKIAPEKPSESSSVSKFKLTDDEDEGGPKLREDNSYLHDNVD